MELRDAEGTTPGALDGLRVLDFTWGFGGAIASLLLADYGAEVVRIEPPAGDPLRTMPAYYLWGRGKKSIQLDLHRPGQRTRAVELARSADVLIHNFRAPALARFGLDYPTLAVANPGLIHCTIGGLGLNGKYANIKAYEGIVAAKCGMMPASPELAGRDGPVYVTTPAASFSAAQLALHG